MKRVLFIVPHEDDEVFIGGPLLINLTRSSYDVIVFIVTNGDYYPSESKKRIDETINALCYIGVKEENIHFGGYGDCWKGKHIYNSFDNENKVSKGGFTRTYLLSNNKMEWHFERYNRHNSYTRNNYKNDIKDIIRFYSPEVIISVDMDAHCDHRAVSLFLDEVVKEILMDNQEYRPILLKKFAYQGVLFGDEDYFCYPFRRTVNTGNITSNPFLFWKDRISYSVPNDCLTLVIYNSTLYKMIRKYRTQKIWKYADSFINSDIVYWMRNVCNVAISSEIEVSSGEKKYLNDFKLVESDNINLQPIDYSRNCWRPSNFDDTPIISIQLKKAGTVKTVIIYFNTPGGVNIQKMSIRFSDNEKSIVDERIFSHCSKNDYSVFKHNFDLIIGVARMDITFFAYEGCLGIGEIEIIEKTQDIPFAEFLFKEKKESSSFIKKGFLKIEKALFRIHKKTIMK